MPISRKRSKVKGLSINNRNYPLIVTHHFGSYSVTTRRNQVIPLENGKTKVIEHYKVIR